MTQRTRFGYLLRIAYESSEDTDEPIAKFKKSVFRVMGQKILGRVGTQFIFNYFFSGKNKILCILKGKMPFKMHKMLSFQKI